MDAKENKKKNNRQRATNTKTTQRPLRAEADAETKPAPTGLYAHTMYSTRWNTMYEI